MSPARPPTGLPAGPAGDFRRPARSGEGSLAPEAPEAPEGRKVCMPTRQRAPFPEPCKIGALSLPANTILRKGRSPGEARPPAGKGPQGPEKGGSCLVPTYRRLYDLLQYWGPSPILHLHGALKTRVGVSQSNCVPSSPGSPPPRETR